MPDAWVYAYVDEVLEDPKVGVNNPWVPDALERQIYFVVVRMLLQMIHFACGVVDQREMFGRTLHAVQSCGDSHLRMVNCPVTISMVDSIVDEVILPAGEGMSIISTTVDRELYRNITRFASRLLIDMASTLRITVFGLPFSLSVMPTQDAITNVSRGRLALDVASFERTCEPLIQDLLADEQINIAMIPDAVEERLYRTMMRLIANVLAAAVDACEVEAAGVRIKPEVH